MWNWRSQKGCEGMVVKLRRHDRGVENEISMRFDLSCTGILNTEERVRAKKVPPGGQLVDSVKIGYYCLILMRMNVLDVLAEEC